VLVSGDPSHCMSAVTVTSFCIEATVTLSMFLTNTAFVNARQYLN